MRIFSISGELVKQIQANDFSMNLKSMLGICHEECTPIFLMETEIHMLMAG